MSVRDLLEAMEGVWTGTYLVFTPDGNQVERFPSRQDTRLEGDVWFERITYLKETPETHDFRARVERDQVVFDTPDLEGTTHQAGPRVLVFPYRWRSRPHEEIVETITLVTPDRRTRLWQHFDAGRLVKLTLIVEERAADARPEV